MDRIEATKTLRELLSARRLIVTFGVAGTMGVIEWLGLGHWIGMVFGLCMGLAALTIAPLPWLWILPWGLKRSRPEIFARALAVIAISAVVVAAGFLLYFAVRDALLVEQYPRIWKAYPHLSAWSSAVISVPLFAAAGWGIARHLQLERRLEIHDEREIALQNALEQSRLLAMQSRLDPHFLFNALNLVAELCRDDALEAERCVVRLSALLRAALDRAQQPTVTLSRELDLCADYLELCRSRFGKRLQVSIERDAASEAVQVPSLAVQVLCENAVRHGIEKRPQGGDVQVKVRDSASHVLITVRSPGPFLGERKGGIGLDLTRKRLALAYRNAASLMVGSTADGSHTEAVLSIPKGQPS